MSALGSRTGRGGVALAFIAAILRRMLRCATLLAILAMPSLAAECPRMAMPIGPLPGVAAELWAGEPLTVLALGSFSAEGAGALLRAAAGTQLAERPEAR